MSTQLIKASINVFIMIALFISLFQDLSSIKTAQELSPQPQNQTEPNAGPEIPGVVVKASDNLIKPVSDMLKSESYNIKVESYDFEGNQWWWEAFIKYGHFVIVYILLGRYQTENNPSMKKKYIIIGVSLMFIWFMVLPKFKIDRIKVQIKGQSVYDNTIFIPQDIIGIIADKVDLEVLQEFDDIPVQAPQVESTPEEVVATSTAVPRQQKAEFEQSEFGDEPF